MLNLLYVNLAFVGQMLQDLRTILEILGPSLTVIGIGLYLIYRAFSGWQAFQFKKLEGTQRLDLEKQAAALDQQKKQAEIDLLKAQAETQIQQTSSDVTRGLVGLLASSSDMLIELTRTLQNMQADISATRNVASQAPAHYASTDAFQEYAKPLLVGIKTTVDRTDLKVGELHTSKLDLVNQVVEVNKAVQHLNQTLTEYLNRDTIIKPANPITPADAEKEAIGELVKSIVELKTDTAPPSGEPPAPTPPEPAQPAITEPPVSLEGGDVVAVERVEDVK